MSGVISALIGMGGSLRKAAEFIGVTVLNGTGVGTAALPTGTQVGDLLMVFAPYAATISGGGAGSWITQTYADKHGYTKTFMQKKLTSLGSVSVTAGNYGPVIVAAYRNCSFAAVISKPEDNTTVLPLADLYGRLPKSSGYLSCYFDRSGDGSGTVPSGWTKRTGPNSSNAIFTGELADLSVSAMPDGPYSGSWTGLSATSSYYQSGWFVHLTDYASQAEFDAAITQVTYERADQILFARMAVQPDSTRKALISSTINSLKAAGVWAKLDGFYAMAAHSDQAGRLNWMKPSFDLIDFTTAPSFTANRGFTTDGGSNGLDTSFTPSTHAVKMSQNSGVMFVRHRTNTQNSYYDVGWSFTSNPTILLGTRGTSDKVTYAMNAAAATTSTATVTNAVKVMAVDRSSGSTQDLYVDGSLLESVSAASTGLMSNGPLKIGRTLGNRYSARQFAFFGYGASLTAAEHLALKTAIESYMTAVGA